MSSANTNHQILKDTQTITKTVLVNIVKMLIYRGWVKNPDPNKLAEELLKTRKDEKIYNVKLSENLADVETYEPFDNKKEWKNFNGNNIVISNGNWEYIQEEGSEDQITIIRDNKKYWQIGTTE